MQRKLHCIALRADTYTHVWIGGGSNGDGDVGTHAVSSQALFYVGFVSRKSDLRATCLPYHPSPITVAEARCPRKGEGQSNEVGCRSIALVLVMTFTRRG